MLIRCSLDYLSDSHIDCLLASAALAQFVLFCKKKLLLHFCAIKQIHDAAKPCESLARGDKGSGYRHTLKQVDDPEGGRLLRLLIAIRSSSRVLVTRNRDPENLFNTNFL